MIERYIYIYIYTVHNYILYTIIILYIGNNLQKKMFVNFVSLWAFANVFFHLKLL